MVSRDGRFDNEEDPSLSLFCVFSRIRTSARMSRSRRRKDALFHRANKSEFEHGIRLSERSPRPQITWRREGVRSLACGAEEGIQRYTEAIKFKVDQEEANERAMNLHRRAAEQYFKGTFFPLPGVAAHFFGFGAQCTCSA